MLLNQVKAVFVRVFLLLHTLLTIWRVILVYGDLYYLLLLATVPFILEGLYTVIKRRGIEWKWVCPCFVLYLLATLPGIWLLEINRTIRFDSINTTAVDDLTINGITIPIQLPADTWVLVIEECLLYFMIIGRWLLPRGQVSRGQLSELLFTFIGIASDIMELFALFDEEPVRQSLILTYALLGVWSWSLFQFTMVLTVAAKPVRIKLIGNENNMMCIEPDKKKGIASFEVIATMVSLFMQDGPFLAMRLYTIIAFGLVNYSLIFFTTKNILIILLLLYRLYVKFSDHCCPENETSVKKASEEDSDYSLKKLEEQHMTKDDIIAILWKDNKALRKRKPPRKNKANDDGTRNSSASANVTMDTILPSDLPSNVTGCDSHENKSNSINTDTIELELPPDANSASPAPETIINDKEGNINSESNASSETIEKKM